ncbi:hypothetical protein C8Q72DRAFT_881758 [Fomitopsis betulina]|nr:hypothetical protein C8Q72DRAFT_881758 [Fomitopsis betulina]
MPILDPLVYRPNRVVEMQRFHQASHDPVYLRTPASKVYIRVYFAAFAAGMLGTAFGAFSLIKGKPANE